MARFIFPYKSGIMTLTSKYGNRILNGKPDYHNGVDLSCTGKTLVAPCDGTIGSSTMITNKNNFTWQWGNYIRIDTADGLQIFMCHMAERKVSVGQKVRAGDIVGIEGNTGYSFGSHCHFEVRKGGKAIDPTPYLGIPNGWGQYRISPAPSAAKTYADDYKIGNFDCHRIKDFKIQYLDADKRRADAARYINGGFFAYYKEGNINFTMPVGNLCCDINPAELSSPALKYLGKYISGNKLTVSCNQNQSSQFRGKAVSTLIVPYSGKPYIADINAIPAGTKYAISGVPTVRDGDDVDYYNYVKKQGWDDSCMYATYRNWLGIRDGEIWCITGRTKAKNYIYGMEFWKQVKAEGFDDIICLDGGGSFYYKNGKTLTTGGSRAVNNIITL